MSKEVEVRITDGSSGDSKPLCKYPIDQLVELLNLLRHHGGVYVDGDYRVDFATQFVYDDTGVFFEIILTEE